MNTKSTFISEDEPPEQHWPFQIAGVSSTFRKPVQIVQSKRQVPLTLLQRKISISWLKNAVDHPPDQDGWLTIGLGSMTDQIDYNSNDRRYLRESSLELMKLVYEWQTFGKMGSFKASVLFPEVEITDDEVRYKISKELRRLLLTKEISVLTD